MKIIEARNVNDAYRQARQLLSVVGQKQSSRAGDVLVAPYPVMTVYDKPTERVLLDERRDANPFFHICEAVWMLSGREDSRWLDVYVKTFSARFAEPSGDQWGAYGWRWRNEFDVDQLEVIVQRLRKNNDDRRVVLQMWHSGLDLFDEKDVAAYGGEPKDVPCNLVVIPRVHDGVLDITVCCRSNDIIWGATGANAVHFSVLQEYLAAAIGVGVGKMYQLSNNWHGYVDVLKKTEEELDPYAGLWINPYENMDMRMFRGVPPLRPQPMVTHPDAFLADCELFVYKRDAIRRGEMVVFMNPWFTQTLISMDRAHAEWRAGDMSCAVGYAEQIQATDWRAAALAWLWRRVK
jgi:thymidylate synthase